MIFIIVYIWVALYILIFRLQYDIVGTAEPEYYPMEIIATIAILLTLIVVTLIYYEDKKITGKMDYLYFALIIVFIAYFLAENNWLLGREYFEGTLIYSGIMAVVFLFTLKRTYELNKTVFLVLLIGLAFLVLATVIDLATDHYLPFEINHPKRLLFEEIPDLFAVLFIFHSMVLLYKHNTRKKCHFKITQNGAMVFIISTVIIGYGNTFLLEDHGQPIPAYRIAIGITMYAIGLLVAFIYFMYLKKK